MPRKSRSRRSRKRKSPKRSQRKRKSPRAALIKHFGKKYVEKFERCVMAVKKKSRGKYNPFAVCHKSIGR